MSDINDLGEVGVEIDEIPIGKKPKSVRKVRLSLGKPKAPVTPDSVVWPSASRPSITLIPESIRQEKLRKSLTVKLVSGVSAFAILLGGVYGAETYIANNQAERLDASLNQGAVLTQSIQKLQYVGDFYKNFNEQQKLLAQQLGTEVAYSKAIESISSGLPVGAELESIDARYGQKYPGANPFEVQPAIGGMRIDVSFKDIDDVTVYLESLFKSESLRDPYVLATSGSESGRYSASITVNFTSDVYSKRASSLIESGSLPDIGLPSPVIEDVSVTGQSTNAPTPSATPTIDTTPTIEEGS